MTTSSSPSQEVFQLIRPNLAYDHAFAHYLHRNHLTSLGSDYHTIGIIGPQSSGKSTLLNRLFQTSFKEMDPKKGRQQTTQGVWISCARDQRIFIMDLEGSDSIERGDQRLVRLWNLCQTFEQTTALLALAFSDVLFVNMWESDVGRAKGSSLQILKTIFEINLKLFTQKSAKKIVFLVRDFDFQDYGEQGYYHMKKATQDILEELWRSISKPKKYANSSFKKFFYFKFQTMPCIKDKLAFKRSIAQLRAQLCDPTSQNYLMDQAESKIPVDALPLFIESSWQKIRSDKDINLPSQKELISNLRCCEIKNEAINSQQDILKTLKKECKNQYESRFGTIGETIVAQALVHYRNAAHHYSQNIFNQVQAQLEKELYDKLFLIFQDQMLILDKNVYDQWKLKVKSFVKDDRVSTHFQYRVSTVLREIIDEVEKKAKFLQVKGSDWHIEGVLENVEDRLKEYARTLRDSELLKLQKLTKGRLEKELGECVHKLMIDLDQHFWKNLHSEYVTVVHDLVAGVEGILTQGFQMEPAEAHGSLEGLEKEGYSLLKRKVLKYCGDLNSILRERFCTLFKLNERGATRDWKQMEEAEIERLCVEAKTCVLKCLSQFAHFKIFPGSGRDKGLSVALNPRLSRGFSAEGEDGTLLEARQLDQIRVRFEEDVELLYDQALNKHHGRGGGKIPWYFWVVAAFFGYEKVFSWLLSPMFLYPLGLLGGCVAILHSVGLSGVVLTAVRLMINRAFRRINLNLHI